MRARTAIRVFAVALVVGGTACGGDTTIGPETVGDTGTAASTDTTVTQATTEATTAATTSEAPSTTSAGTTSAETTTTGPTTTGPTTTDRTGDIDDAALALIAAGLFTVPGADAQCVGDSEYAFPAAGGDLYMVCVHDADDPWFPGRLTLAVGGTVVGAVDISLHPGEPERELTIQQTWSARPTVISHSNGARRALGLRVSDREFPGFEEHRLMVPVFVPHDRPAGDWVVRFTAADGTDHVSPMRVLAPCARSTTPASSIPDPFGFDTSLRFTRIGPVSFAHCLALPDLTGSTLAEAVATLDTFAAQRGIQLESFDVGECGPAGRVISMEPPAGAVDLRSAAAGIGDVRLTVGLDCPVVPDVTGWSFSDAAALLNGLETDHAPDFTWSWIGSCTATSEVTSQSVTGVAANTVRIRCG